MAFETTEPTMKHVYVGVAASAVAFASSGGQDGFLDSLMIGVLMGGMGSWIVDVAQTAGWLPDE